MSKKFQVPPRFASKISSMFLYLAPLIHYIFLSWAMCPSSISFVSYSFFHFSSFLVPLSFFFLLSLILSFPFFSFFLYHVQGNYINVSIFWIWYLFCWVNFKLHVDEPFFSLVPFRIWEDRSSPSSTGVRTEEHRQELPSTTALRGIRRCLLEGINLFGASRRSHEY